MKILHNITKNEKKIIDMLRKDSRASIKSISKKTQIKPSTIYQTILRLKKNGIIKRFTIDLDNRKLGRDFVVFMLVSSSKDLESQFIADDHIESVHGITGEYDLLLKMRFLSPDEFNRFVISFRKNKSIIKTLTMIATATIKE